MTTISDNAAAYLDQRITAVVSARFEAAEQERRQQETERAARREEATATFRTRFEQALNDDALLTALDLRYASEDALPRADPVPYAAFTLDEAELRICENYGNGSYYRLIDPQRFMTDLSKATLADDLLFGLADYRERLERQQQAQAEAAERLAEHERKRVELEQAWRQAQVKTPVAPAEPARIISDSGTRRVVELALDETHAKVAILKRHRELELIEMASHLDSFGDEMATPPQRFVLSASEVQMLVAAWQALHTDASSDANVADDIPF